MVPGRESTVLVIAYLFTTRIIGQFVIDGHVEPLHAGVDRRQDHLVPDDDVVAVRSEFVERENVEPGSLVSGRVQRHSHGVLLLQSGQSLVDRQVLVRLQMKKLRRKKCELQK